MNNIQDSRRARMPERLVRYPPGLVATAIYLTFVCASALLSVSLPESVAEYPNSLVTVASIIQSFIPSIESFVSVSSFPIVTKMFLTIEWVFVPFLTLIIGLKPELIKPNERTLGSLSSLRVVSLLVAAVALLIVYPAMIRIDSEDLIGGMLHERAIRSVSESKLWLGLIGSTVIFTVAYFSALTISYVRALVLKAR